jgi:alkylation response protein AidB-like acyl-CoA dehydrogenase
VPEDAGGIGLGPVEATILAEELGRSVAPGPLLTTVTQCVPVLRRAAPGDARARWLDAIATGAARGTLAAASEPGDLRVRREGGGALVAGTARFVLCGTDVDVIVALGRDRDGDVAAIVPSREVEARAVPTLDATRALTDLHFDDVRVDGADVLELDPDAATAALAEATVGLAAEMVGTAQTIFDVTLEYAKQREQFGVPIGSFQAVKHKFADLAIALERARSTTYFAALTLAEDDPRGPVAASVAKVAAGDCQRMVAKEGIQLHGGIGYTWEHDLHLAVKRVKTGEALLGTSASHRERIAAALLQT